ncbi:ABC transporter substrate-binding protein [Microbacterium sp.]|uniref:ABC transporter substrate-binding protein n=1 Tax=Microbacterium sp. TaxID=51671 RepID=UPI0039E3B4A0
MKRTARLVPLLAISALALSACAGGSSPTSSGSSDGELSGTITFQSWSLKGDKFSPYFEALFDAFTQEHPDVTIEWLDQPGDGYQDKVLNQANSNTLPDVINLPPDIAYPLVEAGVLLDLAGADSSLSDIYLPGGLEAYQYPGIDGTYGLPWYLGTDLAWWNTKAIADNGGDPDNLPTTTEELIELATTVGKASGGTMPVLSSMPTLDVFESAGIATMNDDGEFVFNTPEAAEIVDEYKAAYDAGGIPAEALTGDAGGNADMFKQGKVAFTTATSVFASDLQRDAPSLVPDVKATPRMGDAPLFVQGVSVAANSKNQAAAIAFAKFLTNTENQVAFCKLAVGFMPGTIDGSADTAALAADVTDPLQLEAMDIVSEAMKTARILTPFQWSNAMKVYMDQQLALALKGEIGSQEALDKIVKYANDNRIDN